ncbi:DNA-binding MarR family transcriptional regulator [Bradyrhizobium japonicum]|nr:DNA-binding MarR family transcriptional regulator [Bradyrhizobium japonicum]MCP1780296.1 DNA-binding MarR family transcriptional regulator [Bradyrhizobium japonicum]MCP1859644.1 DNA-binding MarR family transcriptional regulator [Bradyrhizobium japonicum]MCP1890410.1 DNA-binding MarR family transcriptional regulator [Bradyrhizobium japonicum]MCP1956710.1 DNA-binding MarR family transcriptional regulator [Bradyrhizobium japonicum]
MDHEPDIEQGRARVARCGRKPLAGADHRDAVVTADGAPNLLKRGAILRYKRLAGLSSVEFGLVASLGRRPPMSVARLAEAVGQDKGQISRALAELVSRKLIAKSANPKDSREVLVALTAAGLAAHDAIVEGAQERNRQLLEQLSKDEFETLLAQIDRLTATAEKMLEAEKVSR